MTRHVLSKLVYLKLIKINQICKLGFSNSFIGLKILFFFLVFYGKKNSF